MHTHHLACLRFLLLSPGNFPIDLLCVNDTIQTCVKFFYNDFVGTGGGGNSDAKRTYDNLCGDILRIISTVAPRNVEELKTNQSELHSLRQYYMQYSLKLESEAKKKKYLYYVSLIYCLRLDERSEDSSTGL